MEILQAFVLMTPPIFHPNLGVFPFEPDLPCWGQSEQVLYKLFGREFIFEVFQPV